VRSSTHRSLRSIDADGREQVADDETSFRVDCFDPDPGGCTAISITRAQCRAAGGSNVKAGGGQGCEGAAGRSA
jgi:hypothetical protein